MPTLCEDDVSRSDTLDPLFLSARTENRERTRRHRHTALVLEKEVADPVPLEKVDLPMLCCPGEVRTTPQKRKCRLANHSNGNRGAPPFFGPIPWLWVYISRTSPDLSRLFHVERVFFRWHNSGHLFFRLVRMHERAQIPRQESTNADSNQSPKTFSIATPPLAPTALPVACLRYRPKPERRQSRRENPQTGPLGAYVYFFQNLLEHLHASLQSPQADVEILRHLRCMGRLVFDNRQRLLCGHKSGVVFGRLPDFVEPIGSNAKEPLASAADILPRRPRISWIWSGERACLGGILGIRLAKLHFSTDLLFSRWETQEVGFPEKYCNLLALLYILLQFVGTVVHFAAICWHCCTFCCNLLALLYILLQFVVSVVHLRRFYGEIPGNQLPVDFPLFLRTSACRTFLEIKIW